jgi:hypothetical protein
MLGPKVQHNLLFNILYLKANPLVYKVDYPHPLYCVK